MNNRAAALAARLRAASELRQALVERAVVRSSASGSTADVLARMRATGLVVAAARKLAS
jgi:hypothetical protein